MKNEKLIKTAAVLGSLALLAGGVVVADAASNQAAEKLGNGRGQGRMLNLSVEERTTLEAERETRRADAETRRVATRAAISNGSYSEWKAAVGEDHPWVEKITEQNFALFVEAHNNLDSSQEIFAELGLEVDGDFVPGMGQGRGHGQGMGLGMGLGGGRLLNQ